MKILSRIFIGLLLGVVSIASVGFSDEEVTTDGAADVQVKKRSVLFKERSSDPATPAANGLKLYAKDTAGTSGLYIKDDAGTVIQVGSGGGGGSGDIDSVTAGSGLTGGGVSGAVTLNVGAGTAMDVTADAIDWDPTEVTSNRTWADGTDATIAWTWNLSGTDPVWTFGSGTAALTGNISATNLSGTNTGDQTTITGNAGTATALAADPTDCSAGQAPIGINASGVAQSCTTYLQSEVDGSTTNEIQNLFETISTTSGTSPVADSSMDTLTLTAGTAVTVTGDSATDAVTIGLDSTLSDIADGTILEDLVNTANPWADNEVADTITASNYLPLGGGTMTGELKAAAQGIEGTATDTITDCSTFSATGGGIFYDDSEGKFKKCQDNTLSDLDTTGAGATITVEEDNATVDSATTNLDFLGADFDVTSSPAGESNVVVAAALTRDTEWDTESEVQTAWGAVNVLLETEIDASSELSALMDDETGSGAVVFADDASVNLDGGNLEIPNSITLPATCTVGQIYMDTDATTGQRLYACQSTDTWALQGDGGGGGGDSVSVDGVGVVDPNFASTGQIDFVDTSNTVTANINDNSILEADLKAVDSATDEDVLTYESTTGDFEWHTEDEVIASMSAGALPNDSVLEADLKAVDAASDEECLTYETTTGDFEWQACGSGSGSTAMNLPIYSAKLTGAFTVFTPPTADACTQGAQIDAGDGNWRLLFDATTDECATWQFVVPDNYSSTPSLKIKYSMASATANEVEFEGAIMCVTPGDAADIGTASFSNVAVASDTVPGTAGYLDTVTITLTDDSCAAGDIAFVVVSKDADDATLDDATGDTEIVGLEFDYA